jgi:hypothetical protein
MACRLQRGPAQSGGPKLRTGRSREIARVPQENAREGSARPKRNRPSGGSPAMKERMASHAGRASENQREVVV